MRVCLQGVENIITNEYTYLSTFLFSSLFSYVGEDLYLSENSVYHLTDISNYLKTKSH